MKSDDPWPRDPRLDPFRNAVWELSRRGTVRAYLTCRVLPMRSMPLFWEKTESVWFRVNWTDGHRERTREDRGPAWTVVSGLEKGRFELEDIGGTVFDARPVEGAPRDAMWRQYGPSA